MIIKLKLLNETDLYSAIRS